MRREDGDDRVLGIEKRARDALDVGDGHGLHRAHHVVGGGASFERHRPRPGDRDALDGRLLELGVRDLVPLGRLDEVHRHPVLQRLREDAPHVCGDRRAVGAARKGGFPEGEARRRHALDREVGLERLAVRDEREQRSATAREHRRQHASGRVVRPVGTRHAEREQHEAVGSIRRELDALGRHRLEMERGPLRQRLPRQPAEQSLDGGEDRLGFDVARDHQDRVVRRVPSIVEAAEHRRRRPIEGRARAERLELVRRALEDLGEGLLVGDVLGVGQILGDLLLDRAALVTPEIVGGEDAAHARRLDAEWQLDLVGGHREVVLGHRLLRIGVESAAHRRRDARELVGRQAGAAAEHHVLVRVRGARKPLPAPRPTRRDS